MSKFIEVQPGLAISGQITVEDLVEVLAAGFKSIINNRPDGEEFGQPDHQSLKEAAENLGLIYIYQPVNGANIQVSDLETFAQHLNTLPKPILAFCRSGARVNKMLSLLS